MKILTSMILLLGALAVGSSPGLARQAEASNREIDSLVSRLSWDSVGMECDVLGDICLQGDEAKRLAQIGKPATDTLLMLLGDKDKGVVAHIILTQIWEPKKAKGAMRFGRGFRFGRGEYIFSYNGLEWAEVVRERGPSRRVKRGALSKNAAEWRRKIRVYHERDSDGARHDNGMHPTPRHVASHAR